MSLPCTDKDLYLVIESVRNCYDAIASCLNIYFLTIDYRDSGVSEAERCRFWELFGITGELLIVIVMIDLRIETGRVVVAAGLKGRPGILDILRSVYLSVFRFRKFSTTRWVCVCRSTCTLAASVELGLLQIADIVKERGDDHGYYINGLERLEEPLRRYSFCK